MAGHMAAPLAKHDHVWRFDLASRTSLVSLICLLSEAQLMSAQLISMFASRAHGRRNREIAK